MPPTDDDDRMAGSRSVQVVSVGEPLFGKLSLMPVAVRANDFARSGLGGACRDRITDVPEASSL